MGAMSLIDKCGDTILKRPNDYIGLAREGSLTIKFVESGLKRLAFGHRALVQTGFQGTQIGKGFGLDIQAPQFYNLWDWASRIRSEEH